MYPHSDQFVDPSLADQVIDIGLTNAGSYPGDQSVSNAGPDSLEGVVENTGSAAARVADRRCALYADEWGRVARFP